MTDDWSGDLVARWREGDQQAATELFRRYAGRLIALARSRLSVKLAHRIDPEDVVQSVYRTFFADVRADRFELQCGGDLWRCLVVMTLRKLNDQVKRHTSAKRAPEREQSFGGEDSLVAMHAHLLTREPSPIEAVSLAEQLEEVMRPLEPLHRRILELRLQGCTVFEIADAADCGERTVRRVLARIKREFERWFLDSAGS